MSTGSRLPRKDHIRPRRSISHCAITLVTFILFTKKLSFLQFYPAPLSPHSMSWIVSWNWSSKIFWSLAKVVFNLFKQLMKRAPIFAGAQFQVYGREQREIVHCYLQSDVSDLPASRKVSGLAGYTSKYIICPFRDLHRWQRCTWKSELNQEVLVKRRA